MVVLDSPALSNFFGALPPAIKARLREVRRDPRRYWDRDHGIILRAEVGLGLTLWQAVLAVDPTFPRRGRATDINGRVLDDWARYPDTVLIGRALRYAATLQQ